MEDKEFRIRLAGIVPMQNGFAFMHRVGVQNHPIGDYYTFPGGGREGDETLEEGTIREIKEELELDITNLNYLTTVEYDYPSFHLIMHCFICEICGGTLSLNAHNDAKWVSLEQLASQKWIPADIEVVEKLLAVTK